MFALRIDVCPTTLPRTLSAQPCRSWRWRCCSDIQGMNITTFAPDTFAQLPSLLKLYAYTLRYTTILPYTSSTRHYVTIGLITRVCAWGSDISNNPVGNTGLPLTIFNTTPNLISL